MVGPGAYAVTGGTGALGLCVARRLVEEGAKVPVADGSMGLPMDPWLGGTEKKETGFDRHIHLGCLNPLKIYSTFFFGNSTLCLP